MAGVLVMAFITSGAGSYHQPAADTAPEYDRRTDGRTQRATGSLARFEGRGSDGVQAAVDVAGSLAGQTASPLAASVPLAQSLERCPHNRNAVRWYRGRQADWLKLRGAGTELPGGRAPRNCADAHYLAGLWRTRSFRARLAYERWVERHTLDDFTVGDGSRGWLKAVREVQVVYPGTSSWLISCSDSEGGHGRWVPNSQGSGVGGWMQMFPSTFWRMFSAAKDDVESRGYRVPRSAASWYSPLGQALGSAWGLRNGRRGEWYGAGC